MENVRICRIQVKNLFGEVNYDINLGEDNPIAILIAPNGRGKTTVLNLISFVFNPSRESFDAIRRIPFDEFRCILSNDRVVELKKTRKEVEDTENIEEQKATIISMIIERAVNGVLFDSPLNDVLDTEDYVFTIYKGGSIKIHELIYSKEYKGFEQYQLMYIDKDMFDEYMDRGLTADVRFKTIWRKQRRCLVDGDCGISVNYIKADRIQSVSLKSKNDNDEAIQESPLGEASKHIAYRIITASAEYYNAVSEAKDRLPQMFLDGEGGELDCDQFLDGWRDYRNKLNKFQDIGLIFPTKDFTRGKDITDVYKEKGQFLSTYLSAFKDTIDTLEDIYIRLHLFKCIFDERNMITCKKVMFSREGVSIISGEHKINLDMLSSGEKHDFIMFYNLIFNTNDCNLVLIDEPEISLHIEWQETYLDKLIEICKVNSLQAIVATHSPHIVSSHYDFLVDKGETDG